LNHPHIKGLHANAGIRFCAAVTRLVRLPQIAKKGLTMTRALFIATVFAWGTSWYALHFQLGYAPVEVSICYRFGLGCLLLGFFLVMTGRLKPVATRLHLYFALMGFCFFGLNFFLIYNSAVYVATGVASVIFTISAIFNGFNQWLFFGKAPGAHVLAGSALGSLGVACLSSGQFGDASNQAWIGVLLALAGTYIFSLGNMISVRLTALGVDLPNAILRAMAWGTLGAAVASIATGQRFVVPAALEYWAALVWLSLIATVGGSLCYLSLVNRLGAAKAGYITVLFPLIALSLSTLLEGYRWHWIAAVGVLLILLGCLMVFAPSPARLMARFNRRHEAGCDA
jgi:drug/metabolite transporter (DMT)-like permease